MLTTSFPGPSGKASSSDVRRDLAGTVVRDSAGKVRRGLFPTLDGGSVFTGVSGSMEIEAQPFYAVLERDGALFIANDSPLTIPAPAAPSANSRYHVLYLKQNESVTYSDPSDDAELAWVIGATSTNPSLAAALAAIPEGGLRMASWRVPAGVTSMQAAGIVEEQQYPSTAMAGGLLQFRTKAERDSFSPIRGQECLITSNMSKWIHTGSRWILAGGDRPHMEWYWNGGMSDSALRYPKLTFDASVSNVDQNDSPVWTWETGTGLGDGRGLLFNEVGDYEISAHWTLAGRSTGRGFIGFETETDTVLARSHINDDEDRVSVALVAQRITKPGYRMRFVVYKNNGTVGTNFIRVKVVRSQ